MFKIIICSDATNLEQGEMNENCYCTVEELWWKRFAGVVSADGIAVM